MERAFKGKQRALCVRLKTSALYTLPQDTYWIVSHIVSNNITKHNITLFHIFKRIVLYYHFTSTYLIPVCCVIAVCESLDSVSITCNGNKDILFYQYYLHYKTCTQPDLLFGSWCSRGAAFLTGDTWGQHSQTLRHCNRHSLVCNNRHTQCSMRAN